MESGQAGRDAGMDLYRGRKEEEWERNEQGEFRKDREGIEEGEGKEGGGLKEGRNAERNRGRKIEKGEGEKYRDRVIERKTDGDHDKMGEERARGMSR